MLFSISLIVSSVEMTDASSEMNSLNVGSTLLIFQVVNSTHYLFTVSSGYLSFFNTTLNTITNHTLHNSTRPSDFQNQYENIGHWDNANSSLYFDFYANFFRGMNETPQPEWEKNITDLATEAAEAVTSFYDRIALAVTISLSSIPLLLCLAAFIYAKRKSSSCSFPHRNAYSTLDQDPEARSVRQARVASSDSLLPSERTSLVQRKK